MASEGGRKTTRQISEVGMLDQFVNPLAYYSSTEVKSSGGGNVIRSVITL
jgi:hypothetical protein